MTIYAYLDEAVRTLTGFVEKRSTYKGGGESKSYELDGISLSSMNGRLYVSLSGQPSTLPNALRDVVVEYSLSDAYPVNVIRETGLYCVGPAEIELTTELIGGKHHYKVRGRASTVEELIALYRAVRAGTIRPSLSYEDKQGGLSRAELEVQLAWTQKELEETRARLRPDPPGKIQEVVDATYDLFLTLKRGWPSA